MNNHTPTAFKGACLLGLLIAGCSVNQQQEVAEYRKVLDTAAAPTTAPAAAATLTLQQALQLANRNSDTLASTGEDYLQAIIARNRAASAFLPTISAASSYSLRDDGMGGTSDSTTATGSGQMNIFNGGQDLAKYRAATATIQQRRELLLDEQAKLLLNVVATYYEVIKNERQARVYETSIKYQEERVRDTEARVRLGAAKPLDLAQSRSELAATRVSLTQSLLDASNGRSTLAYLIGLPAVENTLSDDLTIPDAPGDLAPFMATALKSRHDLEAARHAAEAARQSVTAAFAQYYPSVSVNFDYLLYHHPDEGGLWSGAISANIPIFSAGRIEADVRTAWSQYRQAGLHEADLRKQIAMEVQQAYENLTGSARKLVDTRDQITAARQALTLSDRSYALGSATNLDRLSSQNSVQNAELDLVKEQLSEKVYYLVLLRRTGQLNLTTLVPSTAPTARS